MLEPGRLVTWTPRSGGKRTPITGMAIGVVKPFQNAKAELLRLRAGRIMRRSQVKFEVPRVSYARVLVEVWVGSTPFYYAPPAEMVREVDKAA